MTSYSPGSRHLNFDLGTGPFSSNFLQWNVIFPWNIPTSKYLLVFAYLANKYEQYIHNQIIIYYRIAYFCIIITINIIRMEV